MTGSRRQRKLARCVFGYAVPFLLVAEAGMLAHLFVFDSMAPEFRTAPGFVSEMLLVPVRWTLSSTLAFVASSAVTRGAAVGVWPWSVVAGLLCGAFVVLAPVPQFWECWVATVAGCLVGTLARERGRLAPNTT